MAVQDEWVRGVFHALARDVPALFLDGLALESHALTEHTFLPLYLHAFFWMEQNPLPAQKF